MAESINPTRNACYEYFKVKKPRFVKINKEKIIEYSKDYVEESKTNSYKDYLPEWKVNPDKEYTSDVYPSDDWKKEEVIDFFGMVNTINFYFWFNEEEGIRKYKHPRVHESVTGSNTMFAVVKKYFNRLNPKSLVDNPITLKEMKEYFMDIPFVQERTEIFNQVGDVFRERGYDSFKDLFGNRRKAFDYGNGLVDVILEELPSFTDNAFYKSYIFPINKRVQLLPAMLYERLGEEVFPIDDIHELTVFADYQVPKSMEILGILEYSPSLKNKVMNRELIQPNSVMENEIRVSTIIGCDLVTKEINEEFENQGVKKKIIDLNVDADFWYQGRNPEYAGIPHHLTKTTNY